MSASNRSEWRRGKSLEFKTRDRGFASPQQRTQAYNFTDEFVSIYKSYYRREEIKYNRSEWCSGRALAFKTIGCGFAPRQRFVFFTRSAFAFNWRLNVI